MGLERKIKNMNSKKYESLFKTLNTSTTSIYNSKLLTARYILDNYCKKDLANPIIQENIKQIKKVLDNGELDLICEVVQEVFFGGEFDKSLRDRIDKYDFENIIDWLEVLKDD